MLMNYAAERFLYRLSRSNRRGQFILKGAMLVAVRIGQPSRPTRDLDLVGTGEPTEAAMEVAVRDIVTTLTEDDGVSFDPGTLRVQPIREDNRYGGIRALMAMVDLGRSNSRMKDFTDLAIAARRVAFDGDTLVAAVRATFRRQQTPLPVGEIIGISAEFAQDERAQANWRAFAGRSQLQGFASLAEVVTELRPFLLPLLERAKRSPNRTEDRRRSANCH